MYQGNYNKKPRSYSGNKEGFSSKKMNYFTEIKNLKRKNYMSDSDRSWKHSLVRNFLFILTIYALLVSVFYSYKQYVKEDSGLNEMLFAALIPTGLFILCSLFILIIRRLWINFVYNARSRKYRASKYASDAHNAEENSNLDEEDADEDKNN